MLQSMRLVSWLTSKTWADLEVVHELLPVAVLHRVGAQLSQKGRGKRIPRTNHHLKKRLIFQ